MTDALISGPCEASRSGARGTGRGVRAAGATLRKTVSDA
jgi:hypothetical protein